MGDREARIHQFQLRPVSNLVIETDRSRLVRNEPTGEPETLRGKLDPKKMGDRAQRVQPTSLKDKMTQNRKSQDKKKERLPGSGYSAIEASAFEGLQYRPRTRETRDAYELILSFVRQLIDLPSDALRSATDEILVILKADDVKDLDKKTQIEREMNIPLPSEKFSQLLNLSKKITDYKESGDKDGRDGAALDDDVGVAVIFDEEEEEEDQEGQEQFEVGDEDVDKDGEEDEDEIAVALSSTQAIEERERADQQRREGLDPRKVDAFWLQRELSKYFSDPLTAQSHARSVLEILQSAKDQRDCENRLVILLDYDKFELVKLLTKNRYTVLFCTRWGQAQTAEAREQVEEEMRSDHAFLPILRALTRMEADEAANEVAAERSARRNQAQAAEEPTAAHAPRSLLDLSEIAFAQGAHFMSNKSVSLPEGSVRKSMKGYEEIHVPALKPKEFAMNERYVMIAEMPEWAQPAFTGVRNLNRIQSQLYRTAFEKDENLLLCAPTGAGKTNVAMLTILHEIGKHIQEDGTFALDGFKIVYVAPMKALVQEMVGNFSKRLSEKFGIRVAELTGDRQLTKAQISDTQIIVTTPEKWDVITRKSADRTYTQLVRLIVIDEIHLLHDDRGPVLESLVARTLRQIEETQEPIRLVGLSATLPNFEDVAMFLRVNPSSGLFVFDNSFRPVPLQQQYIGITEKKAIKRLQLANEITYEKVCEQAGHNQVLIFVHSRKETAKTARMLRDMAIEKQTISNFLREDAPSREVLQTESESTKNPDLKDLLPYGFGIHHAGMTRVDRTLVEDLFADGHVQVLVSTATLAWGVNLPAHTVIIKGTQIYNPEKGRWVEISPQDIMQMLGRAGRPQFDNSGEGIIITTQNEVQYYLSLLNQQLPIESQLISRLPDMLNAEIVLGSVRNREDAVTWLGYTYLYVRMLRAPTVYSVSYDELKEDPSLVMKRVDLIHAASTLLDKHQMLKYDRKTGHFQLTELGRIASHYYITHNSMATYATHLKPYLADVELLKVFAMSEEFKLIPVREEEKLELQKLLERVPIPVKEGIDEPAAKINVLLQAHISQLKLEGFALNADMVYVTQSAGRIMRALFEIALKQGWAQVALRTLNLGKMVSKRMWLSMSPLRQFKGIPESVVRSLEKKDISWDRYYDLNAQELGELIRQPKLGKTIHRAIQQFPKLEVQAHVQPLTRSVLRVELTLTGAFQFDEQVHGPSEPFWIIVEDNDSETILHHEYFILKAKYADEPQTLQFTVPLFEPLPPNYFIRVVSDRWLGSETVLPLSFKRLLLPDKFAPPTELHDLQPIPVSALQAPALKGLYTKFSYFNSIQTQAFNVLFNTDENALICAPTGSGKTVCAELAMLRLWSRDADGRCVCVVPFTSLVEPRVLEWRMKFEPLGKEVVRLTGDATIDLKSLESAHVAVCTPIVWDKLSRRWKQRARVQAIDLFLIDELHLLGGEVGPVLEVNASRMRMISAEREKSEGRGKNRIIGLSYSLANARDVADWLGIAPQATFNFHPNVRPVPLEVQILGFNIPHVPSMLVAMTKPVFLALTSLPHDKPAIVFVPSQGQTRVTALDLITFCSSFEKARVFLHCNLDDLEPHLARLDDQRALRHSLERGIGFYHEGMSRADRELVEQLFNEGVIQVLIASRETCWGMNLEAHMVIIMGTQYYAGKEHRYIDYPITDLFQMMGKAGRPMRDSAGVCALMTHSSKKDFYRKFLFEPLPVESHLDHFLHDHFNAEVVSRAITNKQEAVDYLTWTFLYRRIAQNPNYYNLQGVSHRHLSDHFSELVETTLAELEQAKCIAIEDEFDLSPLNLGMIAAYYYIHYATIEMFGLSLTEKSKLKGLLEMITAAAEFDTLPVRHKEARMIERLYTRLPVKLAAPKYNDPHVKAHVLLQAHFSRVSLPPDLEADQKVVITGAIPLLQACVDVISSSGWLTPAIAAMELTQMIVQAMWDRDAELKQLPHFSADLLQRCVENSVKTIVDLMDLEDRKRKELLSSLSERQLADVARACNRFPAVEVEQSLRADGEGQFTLSVELRRGDAEEDEDVGPVVCPFFPERKMENWWLVVGHPLSNLLLAIKRVSLAGSATAKLSFNAPATLGEHKLVLYAICDSYVGCDQEHEFKVTVTEPRDQEMA